jgi:hypothetical protein
MRLLASTLAAALAATVASGTASAQQVAGNVVPSRPTSIQTVLLEEGYRAKLTTDSTGDPMITSAAGGYEFDILFYDCTDNRDCGSIQFFNRFKEPDNGTLEALNDWNSRKRYANAYRGENGDMILTLDVTMPGDGVSREVFLENLVLWNTLMSDFVGFIWE